MSLTKMASNSFKLILVMLLLPQLAMAAVEPRIVGGFQETNSEPRDFMAYLLIEKSEKPRAKNDTIILTLNGFEYSGKLFSTAKPDDFNGTLVDCGGAESQCEGVSGNICLIQGGNYSVDGKIKNCQAGGGRAAILINDNPDDESGSVGAASVGIPAVSINADKGNDFFNAMGGQVKSEIQGKALFACGGTLIEKDWVLTAAHCVSDQTSDSVKVILGGHDLSAQENELIPVKRIVAHQDFDISSLENDIALVQLEYTPETARKLSFIGSATLDEAIDSGAPAYAFGRGKREQIAPGDDPSSSNKGSAEVFVVELPLIATDVCEDQLAAARTSLGAPPSLAKTLLGNGRLCAGGTQDGGKGSCFGDSGGPLTVVAKEDGLIYLAGVTSGGIGCAHPDIPDLYTRVPAYARAINDVMSGESAELKGEPEITAVLADSGKRSGGGALHVWWWVPLVMFRRRLLKITSR